MPKSLSVVASCLVSAGLAAAVPALAQNSNRTTAQKVVADSTKAIDHAKTDAHFSALLRRARGVFIVPNLVRGAVIVGGEGGQGVLLAHRNGAWSDPAFLSVGSISFGAQAGGEAGPVVMLLMTNKALNDFTQANNFSLNANAGLTIVNYSARGQAPVGKGDVIVWSNASGGFVGASVSGTDITSNPQEDRSFYGRPSTTVQIVKGEVQSAQAKTLRNALPG